MIHRVFLPSRSISKCITEDTLTKKYKLLRIRGAVKASVLVVESSCNSLVAALFYDSKPVYVVSNSCNTIQWIKKGRKI